MGVIGVLNEKSKLISEAKDLPSEEKKGYPKQVFFIIGNEFCERLCYYGLRAILILYLTNRLYYDENTATVIYHSFIMLAYFTPLLGAIIADSCLGKYRTVFYLSIIYCIGSIVLSMGAIPNTLNIMTAVSLLGLFVIAIGTGGIKPCVAAFGGDQFSKGQESYLQKFFSIFYVSINLGSVVATLLTPVLREDVKCFSENTCYSLAFGLPAAFMVAALILFVIGKPFYTINKPSGNVFVRVCSCIGHALSNKMKRKSTEKKKEHWLDYAEDKFNKELISDTKILLHVLVLYLPLPVFWALFEQQGSRWTLQATKMNGRVGDFVIKPDQMQVFNPLLIVAFIPLFDFVIYPLFSKVNLLKKPLQRISTGLLLTAFSFLVAGFIALKLEVSDPFMPAAGESELTLVNNSPCQISITGPRSLSLEKFTSYPVRNIPLGELHYWEVSAPNCRHSPANLSASFNSSENLEIMMITISDNGLQFKKDATEKGKSKGGEPKVKVLYSVENVTGNITFNFQNGETVKSITPDSPTDLFGMSSFEEFPDTSFNVTMNIGTGDDIELGDVKLEIGASYIINVYHNPKQNESNFFVMIPVVQNTVHLLLQVPQYLIVTCGEIMVSITGLEFAYSQSPKSMKSVLQAGWLLTVAVGNLLVLVIAELDMFEKPSHELFFFSSLMALTMVIFSIIAYYYKYVDIENSKSKVSVDTGKGRSNASYEEETDFNK